MTPFITSNTVEVFEAKVIRVVAFPPPKPVVAKTLLVDSEARTTSATSVVPGSPFSSERMPSVFLFTTSLTSTFHHYTSVMSTDSSAYSFTVPSRFTSHFPSVPQKDTGISSFSKKENRVCWVSSSVGILGPKNVARW